MVVLALCLHVSNLGGGDGDGGRFDESFPACAHCGCGGGGGGGGISEAPRPPVRPSFVRLEFCPCVRFSLDDIS